MKKVLLITTLTSLLIVQTLFAQDRRFFVKNSFTSPIVSIDSGVNPYTVFVSGSDGRLMIIDNRTNPRTIYDNYIHPGKTLDVALSTKNRNAPPVILAFENNAYKIFVLSGDKRKTIILPPENGIPQTIQYTEDGESFYIFGPNYRGISFFNAESLSEEPYLANLKNYSFDYVHTGKEPHSEKLYAYSKTTLHLSVENYKMIRNIESENDGENIQFNAVTPGYTALLPISGNQILALKKDKLYLLEESDFSVKRTIQINLEGKATALKGNSEGDRFIVIFEKDKTKFFVKGTVLKERILFDEGKKFLFESEINTVFWGAGSLWIGSENGEVLFLNHNSVNEQIERYPYKKLISLTDIEFKNNRELTLFTDDNKIVPLKIGTLTEPVTLASSDNNKEERESPLFIFGGKGALVNLSQNRINILTRKGNELIFNRELEINPLIEKAVFLEEDLFTLHHTPEGAVITRIYPDGRREAFISSLSRIEGLFLIETPIESVSKNRESNQSTDFRRQILISGRTDKGENRLFYISSPSNNSETDEQNKEGEIKKNEKPVLFNGGVTKNRDIPLLTDITSTDKTGVFLAVAEDGDIYRLVFDKKNELTCTKDISMSIFGKIPGKISSDGETLASLNRDGSLSLFRLNEKRPLATIYIFSEEKWIAIVYKEVKGKLFSSLIASDIMDEAELDKVIRVEKKR